MPRLFGIDCSLRSKSPMLHDGATTCSLMGKLLIAARVLTFAWTLLVSMPAHAQFTSLVIDVDATVLLYCQSPLEFNITADELSKTLTGGLANNSGVGLNAGGQSAVAIGSSLYAQMPPMTGANLVGDISNYSLIALGCGIRTNDLSGRVNVDLKLSNNTVLTGSKGSQIRVNSVKGRLWGFSGPFAASYSYPAFYHLQGGSLVDLGIEFQVNVDLTNALSAGLHSSTVSGTVVVEVTNP